MTRKKGELSPEQAAQAAEIAKQVKAANDMIKYGVPGQPTALTDVNFTNPGADINAAVNLWNAYKAFKSGGAKGAISGTGDTLGAAGPIVGGPVGGAMSIVGAAMQIVGALIPDTKTQRANQIANYLGMSQYLAPAQLAVAQSLRGNLVSENAYGATDTGITATSIRVSPTQVAAEKPASWYSFSGKPSYTILPPQNVANPPGVNTPGVFGQSTAALNDPWQYSQIPGQVLYNQLPGTPNNPQSPMNFNLNVNALDSQSILDRSSDIASAVAKELNLGTGLGQSLQNSIFGPG
jgi:hypothetical protein